jgi:excinuclease UvrABC nuclease subunit
LTFNDETFRAFIALVGRQRSQKSGVYVFTHKATGSKYVGSSNNLSYRLFTYFRHEDNKRDNSGLMLPIVREQGIAAFSL